MPFKLSSMIEVDALRRQGAHAFLVKEHRDGRVEHYPDPSAPADPSTGSARRAASTRGTTSVVDVVRSVTEEDDDTIFDVYWAFDALMRAGEFGVVDAALVALAGHVEELPPIALLAVLSITCAAREKLVRDGLGGRQRFSDLVRARLLRDDPDGAEDLLAGIA